MSFNEQTISIDFGNSYCKVGLRIEGNGDSQLLRDGSFSFDEGNFCIPTIVGQRKSDGIFRYGTEVLEEGSEDIKVYRNWKPLFFEDSDQASQDSLRNALMEDGHDVEDLALGYFTWLRRQVEPICRQNHELEDLEKLPVRITLPAFGNVARATERLEELLSESGWELCHTEQAIPEPVANAIGAFAQGRNAVWSPPQMQGGRPMPMQSDSLMPHYGTMFEDSPFLEAFRMNAMQDLDDPMHWVLVVDLGGYTLDFAMLGFDLEDLSQTFDSSALQSDPPRFARISYPLGVMDLDQMVHDALPPDQQEAMQIMNSDVDQRRLETFHRLCYSNFRPFRVGRTEIGSGSNGELVRGAVDAFAVKIQQLAEKFMDSHQFPRVDQLVLTGGGSNIPAVRKVLIDQLRPGHTHGAVNREAELGVEEDVYTELGHDLVRGATATGGTSVYFEFLAS
tara:strand:+ start:37771 stop:39120 length:1350 start_codon:yes stop_codon:yes gene_type:complete